MKYKLMIKTHLLTDMKYLCVTIKDNYHSYSGSGRAWKKHLKEHGNLQKTQLVFETNDKLEFSKKCLEKSIEFDIVNSPEWANLIFEYGAGEYEYDSNGKRKIKANKKFDEMTEQERKEFEEFCRTSKWFECSICRSITTENSFYGSTHRKCREKSNFEMIPYNK